MHILTTLVYSYVYEIYTYIMTSVCHFFPWLLAAAGVVCGGGTHDHQTKGGRRQRRHEGKGWLDGGPARDATVPRLHTQTPCRTPYLWWIMETITMETMEEPRERDHALSALTEPSAQSLARTAL